MQIRESAEDYLEAILILKGENGNVRAIDIAWASAAPASALP